MDATALTATADMKAALDSVDNMRALGIDTTKYVGLDSAYQTAVATKVLALRPLDLTTTTDLTDTKYTTSAQIKTAYDAEVLVQALKQVNDATTVGATETAIENNAASLGLDKTLYNTLGVTFKTNVASAIFNAKAIQPSGQYASAATVKTAFVNAVATQGPIAIQAGLTAVNAVTIAGTVATTTEQATMETAIEANGTVLGLSIQVVNGNVAASDYANLSAADKLVVAKAVLEGKGTGYISKDAVKTTFDNAVATQKAAEITAALAVAMTAVNGATTDTTMQTALENNAASLGLATGTKSVYSTLGVDYKTQVGQMVYDAKILKTGGIYTSATDVKTDFDNAVAQRKTVQDGQARMAALTAVNSAKTIPIHGTLNDPVNATAIGIVVSGNTSQYATLRSAFQTAVDNAVVAPIIASTPILYPTVDDIKTAFNNAVTAQLVAQTNEDAAINAINAVTVINTVVPTTAEQTAMKTALEANAGVLKLGVSGKLDDYNALSSVSKIIVANAVITSRTAETGYVFAKETGATDIKTSFNNAVATEKGNQTISFNGVNSAATVADMTAAITGTNAATLALDLTAYNTLSLTYKNDVAQTMLTIKASNGGAFATIGAVQTAFNNAVTAKTGTQTAVAAAVTAVNGATTTSMRNVLETNAQTLGFDLTAYNLLSDAAKTGVGSTVFTARPATVGYASSLEIKGQFDAAVAAGELQTVSIARAAINGATSITSMRAALESTTPANATLLGLDTTSLTSYNGLSTTAKAYVAQSLLDGKIGQTGGQYQTAVAINNVFMAAVVDVTAPVNLTNVLYDNGLIENTSDDTITLTFSRDVKEVGSAADYKVEVDTTGTSFTSPLTLSAASDYTVVDGAADTVVIDLTSAGQAKIKNVTVGAIKVTVINPSNVAPTVGTAVGTDLTVDAAALNPGPAAPLTVGKTDETASGLNDGTLTGVAAGEEYQVNATGAWIAITGTTVSSLAPGSYTVRVAATATNSAGTATAALVIAGL